MEATGLATLGWTARIKALAARSTKADAESWAVAHRAPVSAIKAAIGSGGTSDLGVAGGLNISAWIESARTASAFYRILADGAFRRIPLRARAIVMSGASAAVVVEGAAVPISKMVLTPVLLAPVKVSGMIVQTNEVLRDVSAVGQLALNKELLGVVSTAVDGKFLSVVATGAPTSASAGVTAINSYHDLRTALLSVVTSNSRPYWICAPDVAVKASTLSDASGVAAHPAMSASGGELVQVPAVVSSALAAGELYCIDANSVVADAEAPVVDIGTHGDIEMSTTPVGSSATPTPAQLVSLWQTDSTAIRINAEFGVQVLRTTASYKISAINWG